VKVERVPVNLYMSLQVFLDSGGMALQRERATVDVVDEVQNIVK